MCYDFRRNASQRILNELNTMGNPDRDGVVTLRHTERGAELKLKIHDVSMVVGNFKVPLNSLWKFNE